MFLSTEHPLNAARVVFVEFAGVTSDVPATRAFLADCQQAARSVVVAATDKPEAEMISWLEDQEIDDLVDGVVSPWSEDAFVAAASALAADPHRCAVLGTSWAFLSAATEPGRVVALAPALADRVRLALHGLHTARNLADPDAVPLAILRDVTGERAKPPDGQYLNGPWALEVAAWLSSSIGAGVLGNFAYDQVRAIGGRWKRRRKDAFLYRADALTLALAALKAQWGEQSFGTEPLEFDSEERDHEGLWTFQFRHGRFAYYAQVPSTDPAVTAVAVGRRTLDELPRL